MRDIDESKRRLLIQLLSAGVFAAGSGGILRPVWAMGQVPRELPPGKSIYDVRGEVLVDSKKATLDTSIRVNSLIETGAGSYVIFAVGKDAFILREHSTLQLSGSSILQGMKLLSGKVLSVFGKRDAKQTMGIKTITATIGIRGTGIYVEAEPEQSYVCTCYGAVDLVANKDDKSREQVITQHHDAPRYILSNESAGNNIRPAPMINHTDDELALIETLVGREVPFAFSGGYGTPRKSGY